MRWDVNGPRAAGATLCGGRRPIRPPRIPQRAKSLGVLAPGTGSEEFGAGPWFKNACAAAPGRTLWVLAEKGRKPRPFALGMDRPTKLIIHWCYLFSVHMNTFWVGLRQFFES